MTRALWIVVLAAALGMPAVAQEAAPAPDLRARAQRAAERIRALQREADRLAAEARTVFGDLRKLDIDRRIAAETLAAREAELAAVEGQLAAGAERVRRLEAQRVAGTPGVAGRLVDIYKRGRGGYVRLIFSSDDLRALGRVSRGVAALARLDATRIAEHRRTLDEERRALADLEARRAIAVAARTGAATARSALDRAAVARGRLIDDLDRRRDLAARYIGELQAAQAAMDRAIAAAGPEGAAPVPLPLAPFRGALDWPIRGPVVTRFGRAKDRFGTSVARNGIEIGASDGALARAVHDGVVAFAAPFAGFGTLVIVDHGSGAYSLYGHLDDAEVVKGTRVDRGAPIGRVGRAPTGGPALYFEIRIDGRPVDPLQWLRSAP